MILTARLDGVLVGVSRALTDFAFCTYLSDLAVDEAHQRQGIGRELIRRTPRDDWPAYDANPLGSAEGTVILSVHRHDKTRVLLGKGPSDTQRVRTRTPCPVPCARHAFRCERSSRPRDRVFFFVNCPKPIQHFRSILLSRSFDVVATYEGRKQGCAESSDRKQMALARAQDGPISLHRELLLHPMRRDIVQFGRTRGLHGYGQWRTACPVYGSYGNGRVTLNPDLTSRMSASVCRSKTTHLPIKEPCSHATTFSLATSGWPSKVIE